MSSQEDLPQASGLQQQTVKHDYNFVLKQILRWLMVMINELHVPMVLGFKSKFGQFDVHGAELLKQKLLETFENSYSWKTTFEKQQAKLNKLRKKKLVSPLKALKLAQENTKTPILPMPLDAMEIEQLYKYVTSLLYVEYERKGCPKNQWGAIYKTVNFGKEVFAAEWWLESEWPWKNVTRNFRNIKLPKTCASGSMKVFLENTVRSYFRHYGLRLRDYESKTYSKTKYAKKMITTKKFRDMYLEKNKTPNTSLSSVDSSPSSHKTVDQTSNTKSPRVSPNVSLSKRKTIGGMKSRQQLLNTSDTSLASDISLRLRDKYLDNMDNSPVKSPQNSQNNQSILTSSSEPSDQPPATGRQQQQVAAAGGAGLELGHGARRGGQRASPGGQPQQQQQQQQQIAGPRPHRAGDVAGKGGREDDVIRHSGGRVEARGGEAVTVCNIYISTSKL